jgi:hypothetical protein
LPQGAQAAYGDSRDEVALTKFFATSAVTSGEQIDAQTFEGIFDESVDFLISAHVIEHLRDPLGAIVQGLRVLKKSKPFVLVVPDMGPTFDRHRPETTVAHALCDFTDGGESTCFQAYEEHLRFVHPYLTGETYSEAEIQWQATESVRRWRELDVHFHAWTRTGFEGGDGMAQFRDVVSCDIPKHLIDHFIVAMDHHVAHGDHLSPRNRLVLCSPLFRHPRRRFAD